MRYEVVDITQRKVARIFEDVYGYYVCVEADTMLDARGAACKTKADAMRRAVRQGYTHGIGSGTYWGNTVRALTRFME